MNHLLEFKLGKCWKIFVIISTSLSFILLLIVDIFEVMTREVDESKFS